MSSLAEPKTPVMEGYIVGMRVADDLVSVGTMDNPNAVIPGLTTVEATVRLCGDPGDIHHVYMAGGKLVFHAADRKLDGSGVVFPRNKVSVDWWSWLGLAIVIGILGVHLL